MIVAQGLLLHILNNLPYQKWKTNDDLNFLFYFKFQNVDVFEHFAKLLMGCLSATWKVLTKIKTKHTLRLSSAAILSVDMSST